MTNALSPAKVQRVSIVDDHERVMEVVVEDKQLSLAIGKKGQNVRLAAKLTGWRIDIKSEEEKRREVEAQFEGLEVPAERGEPTARRRASDRETSRRRPSARALEAGAASRRGATAPVHGGGAPTAEARAAPTRRRQPRGAGSDRGERRTEPRRRQVDSRQVRRSRNSEVTVGHCSDLQSRGTARTRPARKWSRC